MTLKELIQRAVEIANQGLTEAAATEAAAEAHLPAVFHAVGVKAAANERLRTTLRRTKSLVFVSGAVSLPSDVLTAYITEGNLLDPIDKTKLYSLAPWDQLTTGTLDQRLGHFAIEGESTMHVVEPGNVYDPALGPDLSLLLTVPCIPAIPALITGSIAVIDEVADDLTSTLAVALRLAASQ